jgi:biotin carboxyl carrier protein
MEAMKMQASIYANADGVVERSEVSVSDTVESKDLLVKLRAR